MRLTQLYEQARWDLLLEETDCTEEEMMVFAALQVRGRPSGEVWGTVGAWTVSSALPVPPTQYHINKLSQSGEIGEPTSSDPGLDDLDAALSNLEVKLEGASSTDVLVSRGGG